MDGLLNGIFEFCGPWPYYSFSNAKSGEFFFNFSFFCRNHLFQLRSHPCLVPVKLIDKVNLSDSN